MIVEFLQSEVKIQKSCLKFQIKIKTTRKYLLKFKTTEFSLVF